MAGRELEFRWRRRLAWFCLTVVLLVGLGTAGGATTVQEKAGQYNQQGFVLLGQGRASEALSTWQRATDLYRQAGNSTGIAGSQLNQALAMQALGLGSRACQMTVNVLEMPDELCLRPGEARSSVPIAALQPATALPANLQALGLRILGHSLNQMGQTSEAEAVLLKAFDLITPGSPEASEVRLTLGSTYRLEADAARNLYLGSDDLVAQNQLAIRLSQNIKQAAAQYRSIIAAAQQPATLQAQINWLSLAADLEDWLERNQLQRLPDAETLTLQELEPAWGYLGQLLSPTAFEPLAPKQSADANLALAQALLKRPQRLEPATLQAQILRLLERSIQQSQILGDNRSLSYAYGLLGQAIQRQDAPPDRVLAAYQAAISYGEAARANDIIYRWQQQAARIYVAQGDSARAAALYEKALASLQQVSSNLAGINPNIQFSFREAVEPVYRDYLKLLFGQPQRNYDKIIQVNELFQVAELENYLRCGQIALDWLPVDSPSIRTQAATIYVISLEDSIKVVVRSGDLVREYSAPAAELEAAAQNLRINLQSETLMDVDPALLRQYSYELYRYLLQPADQDGILPHEGVVAFVLDSRLQNIPMGLLYDGSRYLVERYSLVLANSRIRPPQQLQASQFRGLVAGVSETAPSFTNPITPPLKPLPAIAVEIEQVRRNLRSSVVLLDAAFTTERLEQRLNQSNLPILHISTHGQFSSDPEQTVLVAWDSLISSTDFDQLLQNASSGGTELLVLSACQTAKGDRRSALGIAGIAVQTGTRSTVATLWTVDAESTAVLMAQFYQNLRAGMPKAAALREAQLTMLNSDAFSHPYFWAGVILIGGWL